MNIFFMQIILNKQLSVCQIYESWQDLQVQNCSAGKKNIPLYT